MIKLSVTIDYSESALTNKLVGSKIFTRALTPGHL